MAIHFDKGNRAFKIVRTPPLRMGLHSLAAEYKLKVGGIYATDGRMTTPPNEVMLDIPDDNTRKIDETHPEVKRKTYLLLSLKKQKGW